MWRREEKAIFSLLRIPCRSLPWRALFNLVVVGGPEIRHAMAMTRAAHFRCAWGSRERWVQSLAELWRAVAAAKPLALIGRVETTCGWCSSDIEAAVVAEATWLLVLRYVGPGWRRRCFAPDSCASLGPTLGIERAGVLAVANILPTSVDIGQRWRKFGETSPKAAGAWGLACQHIWPTSANGVSEA